MDFTVVTGIGLVVVLALFALVSPAHLGPRRRFESGSLVTRSEDGGRF